MTLLKKAGSLVAVWIKSLAPAARCFFCSGSRSCRMNFAMTHFMPRFCIKILDTVLFGTPRSASSSHTVSCQSSLIAARMCSIFSGVLLVPCLLECCRGMFKLNTKFDADSLLYTLSHFECDGFTVHVFIQLCLPPPLMSTVKSSLFTCVSQSTLLGCQVTSMPHKLFS